jgi:selenocysteine lyase/cysteine desulfurase
MNTKSQALIDLIRQSVIGEGVAITTAFGKKPLVYADYTASGRALSFIEDIIQKQVLPFYANTHTETSYTGAQSTALREGARNQIRQAVNAGKDDQVIFCGSGATAAIHKLIDILNLRLPADLNAQYQLEQQIPEAERPVVFIGPYEHHSNELPWRESIATVVSIPLNSKGLIDLLELENQLEHYRDRRLKIGSFSAASNVTGVKTDVDTLARLLHNKGALVFLDYAAAAPYVGIDVQGEINDQGDNSKDAVFISPHKFIGGPGTPGVLVVKKHVLKNSVPAVPGGGTVVYVTPEDHRYIDAPERSEEGGTPAIVESIRAGLVFKLQQDVGCEEIEARESDFLARAKARWDLHDNIEVLGNPDAPCLSITSLRIKHQGKDLHYGFIVALLNDLFGIQSRGGCSCAGPYGHSLLGMDMDYSKALEAELLKGQMVLRPGWVRLNFNYFIDEDSFVYLVNAISLLAESAWRLLPFYHFDQNSGVWRYQNFKGGVGTVLADIDFLQREDCTSPPSCKFSFSECLALAAEELNKNRSDEVRSRLDLPEKSDQLRWFVTPQEIKL